MNKNHAVIKTAAAMLLISALLSCGAGGNVKDETKVFFENEIRPGSAFSEATVNSVAVMRFDGKSVKTYSGEVVDYIELANDFTDDIISGLYQVGKVKVAVGEYEDSISERDYIEKKSGDLDIRTTHTIREITFKAAPYKKIDALLSGRIEKFDRAPNYYKSFIEVSFKLVSSYDGEVLWISRMRGEYRNVVKTLVVTLSSGKYSEPVRRVAPAESTTTSTND